jgi:hypothetical protein
MSLYDDRFESDWDALDRQAAIERAFALGVAARLGEPDPEEFEAVQAEMSTNYDSSIVDLAYQQGRQKVSERREITDDEADADDGEWVMSEELADATPAEYDPDADIDRATDLPAAVSKRTEATDRPDPDPEHTEFPDFLE